MQALSQLSYSPGINGSADSRAGPRGCQLDSAISALQSTFSILVSFCQGLSDKASQVFLEKLYPAYRFHPDR